MHDNYRVSIRETFRPDLKPEGKGHISFGGGNIGSGSFVYKTEVWNNLKLFGETHLPVVNDPYKFADEFKKVFPETKDFFGESELGNPWGDDFGAFYMLTREHFSRPLDTALYIQFGKYGKNWS